MKTDINAVLREYENLYVRILNEYYPAKRSVGFTERNQSVNLSKSLEKIHPDSFSWFEVPFSEDSKGHIDALIVNKETKEIFIVEAKRFSNVNKKIRDVCCDIERIDKISNVRSLIEELENRETYSIYGVILADVWTETTKKKMIADLWKDDHEGFFRGDYFSTTSPCHDVEVMEKINFSKKIVNHVVKSYIENYRLLVYIWKLNIDE